MDVYRNSASLIERAVRLEEENATLSKRVAQVRRLEAEITALRARLRRHKAIRGLELLACSAMLAMGLALASSLLRVC